MGFRTRRDPDAEPITDPDACREAALKLLERTRRTRSDLSRRLVDKGFAPATIAEVIERLAGVGLIDDTEYARAFLAGRLGRRATGWRRLQMQLRGKGVSDADVTAARARSAARSTARCAAPRGARR